MKYLANVSKKIRSSCLESVHSANSSHIGSALSIVDILVILFYKILIFKKKDPAYPKRDRFILSKGHACIALYSCLAELGFFKKELLSTYGQDGSLLMTHVSHKIPGVEFSTGSLGHGLPFGCGKALAAKHKNESWRTFVLLSDGELNEGSNWEAILFAPQHKMDNLVVIVDYNKIQSLGPVADIMQLEPLSKKFKAFGWAVREVNGHDHDELFAVFSLLPFEKRKPSCVIAHTIKGKGVDFMENQIKWHYSTPNKEQLSVALAQVKKVSPK